MSNQFSDAEYRQFCQFLEQQCGIVLGNNKQYLLKSRLTPLLEQFGLQSLSELLQRVVRPGERQLRAAVVDAMTTNETLWFRDGYPFEVLKNRILPEFQAAKKPLRIWSAACSSGQEPYSIAMTLLEYQQKHPGCPIGRSQIVATDISPTMLELCRKAEYDRLALARGLSEERRRQFFEPVNENRMRLKAEVRRMVSFRQLNLLDNYGLLGKFDIIFCRNVLIYFAPEVKASILTKFAQSLNSRGYLFLGASESLSGLSDAFDMIRCHPGIVYQKKQ